MKINLTICGLKELAAQSETPWTHVVSIWDKAHLYDTACRKLVTEIAPQAQLLFCFFEDVDDPNCPGAPILRDVKRVLDFTSQIPAKAKVLVHCRAGVSRSTATAYSILCQHTKPGKEMDNLLHVQTLRDLVLPNRLVIRHADKVLKRDGAMLLHLYHPDH